MNLNKNKIGIIGVGKLGLPYALCFEKSGMQVVASSYKKEYVVELQSKIHRTPEPKVQEYLKSAKNIEYTIDNHYVIKNCDIIYVMVPTPSQETGDYDISAVKQVANDFLSYPGSVTGKVLIIGSTVNPGDTETIENMLSDTGLHVVYSPTFVAQGSVVNNIFNPGGILIGTENKDVAEIIKDIFSKISNTDTKIVQVSPKSAEILKLAKNCYSTMRIAFANKIGEMLAKCDLDHDIVESMKVFNELDSMQGKLRFGFGYGGPCFPRDNRSFKYFADKNKIDYKLGEVIDNFNITHNQFLFDWLTKRNNKNLPFYFPYLTYKPGTTITEESCQFELCKMFLESDYQIYVQKSPYLPKEFIDFLNLHYSKNVKYVDKQDLIAKNIEFFEIDI